MTRLSTDAVIVAFLLEDEALNGLTEQRIWGGVTYPPRGADYKLSDGGAICFKTVSGIDDYTDLLRHDRVQFKCYAASRAKADALSGVLHEALQNKSTSVIKWARRTLTPSIIIEPDTDWPFAFCQYSIMVNQEE